MWHVGKCGCSLLGRFLIFATRNSTGCTEPVQRFSKAGSPPCAVMLTDTARSVA